jgi:regulator of protease activity HflC (stomatin/prohibitin superfamily)
MAELIVLGVVAAFVLFVLSRSVRIVPQARAGVIERLGRYNRTLDAGLALVIPFIDRVRPLIDLREQVVSFEPQSVITEDNLVVHIDTVIYFQVTDAKAATYEIADFIRAIEQLTVTTLRNVIGSLTLEDTLTSRDEINHKLRGVLDEATGKWGIRVNRVESKAIETVFEAIHRGDADPKLLAYQYLQMLPQIAQGDSNKIWIIPSEFVQTLGRFAGALGPGGDAGGAEPSRES